MNISLEELDNYYKITYNYNVINIGKYNHYVLNMEDVNKIFGTSIPSKNQSLEQLLQNPVVNQIKAFKSMISIIQRSILEYENKNKENEIEDDRSEQISTTVVISDISKCKRMRILEDIFIRIKMLKYISIVLIILIVILLIIELPKIEIHFSKFK